MPLTGPESLPGSPRLVFTPFGHDHIGFAPAYLARPSHTRYLPHGRPYPRGLAVEWAARRITHWQTHGFGTFILSLKDEDHAPIGFCGLEFARDSGLVDIRYGLIKEAWGRGLALEAAQALITFGFRALGLDRIYGAAVPENRASAAILEKSGMAPDPGFKVYGDRVSPFSIRTSGA